MNLARTATWLAAGRGLVAMVALVLPILLARILTREDYGLYKQIDLAAALLMPFLLLGFDKSITFYVPRKGRDAATEVSTPIASLLGIASAVLVFALVAPELFGRLLGAAPLPLLVAAAATYAAASALHVVGGRTLVAVDAAREAAILPVIVGVPRTIALVAVVLVDPALEAILRVILVFAAITVVAWLWLLVRKRCLRPAFQRRVLSRHLRYGGVLAFGSVAQAWGNQLDNYLVSSSLPPATFAIYRVGRTRIPFLPIFSRALIDATAPRYSRLESEGRHEEMAALWRRSFEILFPIGLLVSAFLSSTAHWSIPLVFPDYVESVPIFRVFAFAILLESLIGIEQLLRAMAALRFLVVSTIVSLAVRIALGLLVLANGPLWLLTLTQLLVALGLFGARLFYVRRRLDVPWSTLTPLRVLAGPLPLIALGLGGTWLIADRWNAPDWAHLLAGAPIWAALVLWVIVRQGLIARVLPRRFRSRG